MIVADFSMNNGRENRNNGNQEKGKKEKEALRKSVRSQKRGTPKASPKFLRGCCCPGSLRADQSSPLFPKFRAGIGPGFGTRFSWAGHNPRNAQKLQ
jgi:hypothetical protein